MQDPEQPAQSTADVERGPGSQGGVVLQVSPADNDTDQSLPSIIFTTPDGETYAATRDANGDWTVWVQQWTGRALQWARENRPQITTGFKTLAASIIFTSSAIDAFGKGDNEAVVKYVKSAGNILMSLTGASDVGHYLHSAIVNFWKDPRESLYDFTKAAVQGVATGVGISNGTVPVFRNDQQAAWDMANAIMTAAAFYATGPTTTEKIADRRRNNLGRSHQDLSLVNLPASALRPGTQEPGASAHGSTGASSSGAESVFGTSQAGPSASRGARSGRSTGRG
ncbi:hypothetical protein ACFUIW_17880 [Streptomyces sp. NPDC057245]|uniref:hypothetical protein n=1 Tax=Streptomyces TaxID=1883 RepID=UPI001C1E0341|nr:hypothetical protein [Streptomyces sp. A108]MBU6534030.1 hypothetical protein [Streptomyces sp. A108]